MKKKENATASVRLYPSTRVRLRRKAFNSKVTIAEYVEKLERTSAAGRKQLI